MANPSAEVRNLMSVLQIAGVMEGDLISSLAPTYAHVCDEALDGFEPEYGAGVMLNFSAEGQANFAATLRMFSESNYVKTLRQWNVNDPQTITSSFGRFLQDGNCPKNSPYALRQTLIKEFDILTDLFASQSPRTGNSAEATRQYDSVTKQVQNIWYALNEGSFEDEQLRVLNVILYLAHDPEKRNIARGLILLSQGEEDGSIRFSPRFLQLVREAENFDAQTWRSKLQHVFSSLIIRRMIRMETWEWDQVIETTVQSVLRGKSMLAPPMYNFQLTGEEEVQFSLRSLLVMLDNGEVDLVGDFLDILAAWNMPPSVFDTLIHVSASQRLNDVRRALIERAIRIAESEDSEGYMERPLASHIAALMAYPAEHPELEENLLHVIDKYTHPALGAGHYRDNSDDEFVLIFIKAMLVLYDKAKKEEMNPVMRRRVVLESPVAKALEIAATQRMNEIRNYLLRNALSASYEYTGMTDARAYLAPMLDPDETEIIDSSDMDPATYWYRNWFQKKMGNGNGGIGGPTTPVSSSGSGQVSPPASSGGMSGSPIFDVEHVYTGEPIGTQITGFWPAPSQSVSSIGLFMAAGFDSVCGYNIIFGNDVINMDMFPYISWQQISGFVPSSVPHQNVVNMMVQ